MNKNNNDFAYRALNKKMPASKTSWKRIKSSLTQKIKEL